MPLFTSLLCLLEWTIITSEVHNVKRNPSNMGLFLIILSFVFTHRALSEIMGLAGDIREDRHADAYGPRAVSE
jgi:hypothetical protein